MDIKKIEKHLRELEAAAGFERPMPTFRVEYYCGLGLRRHEFRTPAESHVSAISKANDWLRSHGIEGLGFTATDITEENLVLVADVTRRVTGGAV